MNMDEFQRQAMQSIAIDDKSVAALAHRTLGLTGEAGIVANAMKKVIRDKDGQMTDEDRALLKEKLGDVMYYVATVADYADIKLSDVADGNLAKSRAFKARRQTK